MTFECSYAGVGLLVPTQESLAWANENISPADLRDVQAPPRRPGKNLRGLAWDDPIEAQSPRIGEFHWPSGATRWACGRFLVTGAKAFEILTKVIPGGPGAGYRGDNLILQSDGGLPPDLGDTPPSITARMYALPPRPLAGLVLDPAQTDATKDLYLLTLVDIRYFWQWATVTAKGGAWDELVAACAAGLDIDLDAGSIDPVYGRAAPDSGLWVNEENAALVLDAALWNTGRVLAANYDGTFTIQKVIDCREAVKRERKFWRDARTAGGPALNLDAAIGDEWRKALLPQTVRVTFPKVVEGEDYVRPADDLRGWHLDSYGSVHSVQIDLTTLDGYKQHVGTTLTWSKTFHDTAFALLPDADAAGDPDNQHDLWCLATLLAKNYADGLLSRLDEVYPGVLPWTPDGVNDVLVTYRTEDARTRIRGRPFNAGVTEFQHCLPFGGSGSGADTGSGCGSGPIGDDCPRTKRAGAGTDDDSGFWAWLQAGPDDPIHPVGDPGGVPTFDCGSGAGSGSTQEGCPRGYAWVRVTTDGCGRWQILRSASGVGVASGGTQCVRPAYEVNGLRAPVGITDSDGNARYTVVWLRRAPANDFAGHPDRQGAPVSYLFDWNLAQCRQGDADVPSGSGVGFAGRSNVVEIAFPFLNDAGICCIKTVTMTHSPTVEVCVTESVYCPPSGSGG